MFVNSYEEVTDAKILNTRLALQELQTHKHPHTPTVSILGMLSFSSKRVLKSIELLRSNKLR